MLCILMVMGAADAALAKAGAPKVLAAAPPTAAVARKRRREIP
jgi:hypothetical protein